MSVSRQALFKRSTRGDRFIPTRLVDESMDVRQFLMYASPFVPTDTSNKSAITNEDASPTTTALLTTSPTSTSKYTSAMAHCMFGSGDAPLMAEYGATSQTSSTVTTFNNTPSPSSSSTTMAPSARMHTFSQHNPFDEKSALQVNVYDRAHRLFNCNSPTDNTTFSSSFNLNREPPPTSLINAIPDIVLDAPGLVDDFYMDVLDWSSQNLIAIALYDRVLLYNPTKKIIVHNFVVINDIAIAAVKFSPNGEHLAISLYGGSVHIWDVVQSCVIQNYEPPAMEQFISSSVMRQRAACLAWYPNTHGSSPLLSVGGSQPRIYHYDALRTPSSEFQWHVSDSKGVAGLVYSPNGETLAAGTCNGNVLLWTNLSSSSMNNTASSPPCSMLNAVHKNNATVRALAFCPWRANILATGGGEKDRTVQIWNISSPSLTDTIATTTAVQCVKTLSQIGQVTNVLWRAPVALRHRASRSRNAAVQASSSGGHLIVTQGFSANALVNSYRSFGTWRNSGCTANSHEMNCTRALFSAISPDGRTLAVGDSNERLCFWNLHS